MSFAPATAAAAAAIFAPASPAHASYAMTQAAQSSHTWEATSKDKERAVYASIEAALDEKRRFRDDAGELGYVGGSYTKKSAKKAQKLESAQQQTEDSSGSKYMQLPEDLMVLSAPARRLAQP